MRLINGPEHQLLQGSISHVGSHTSKSAETRNEVVVLPTLELVWCSSLGLSIPKMIRLCCCTVNHGSDARPYKRSNLNSGKSNRSQRRPRIYDDLQAKASPDESLKTGKNYRGEGSKGKLCSIRPPRILNESSPKTVNKDRTRHCWKVVHISPDRLKYWSAWTLHIHLNFVHLALASLDSTNTTRHKPVISQ